MEIREATAAEVDIIIEFNAAMAYETENKNLDYDLLTQGVKAIFSQPANGTYYVAEVSRKIVGQLLITREWSDWRHAHFWWIQSVYVAPEWRRQGVFKALYRHVEQLARHDPHVCGLRLYVERENFKAQLAYQSLGMHLAPYLMFETEFHHN